MFAPPFCARALKQVRTFQDVSFHASADGDTNKRAFIVREASPSGARRAPRRVQRSVNLHSERSRLSFKAPARQVEAFLLCKYTWNLL